MRYYAIIAMIAIRAVHATKPAKNYIHYMVIVIGSIDGNNINSDKFHFYAFMLLLFG